MTEITERHHTYDITAFEESVEEPVGVYEKAGTAEKIIALIRINPRHSAKSLAKTIGITAKGVEKQLAKLKARGIIRRIGPAKGGHWEIVS